jgi:hypothetical protein
VNGSFGKFQLKQQYTLFRLFMPSRREARKTRGQRLRQDAFEFRHGVRAAD